MPHPWTYQSAHHCTNSDYGQTRANSRSGSPHKNSCKMVASYRSSGPTAWAPRSLGFPHLPLEWLENCSWDDFESSSSCCLISSSLGWRLSFNVILIRHLLVHPLHLYWRRIGIWFSLCFCWPTFHSPVNCMSWQRMKTIFCQLFSNDLASQPSVPPLNPLAVYWIWQTDFTETLSFRAFHCSYSQYFESWPGTNFSGHRCRLTFCRSSLGSPFGVSL